MKKIEAFGAWVSDFGWVYLLAALALGVFGLSLRGPRTELLSEKYFECTATEAVGIHAVCTQYTKKALYRGIEK